MKLPQLLALVGFSITVVLSEGTDTNEQLLARASAQLERLAPYRKTSPGEGTSDEQWRVLENTTKDPGKEQLDDRRMAFEIYQILPVSVQKDIARRVGGDEAVFELLTNPKYMAFMQERIKRSGSKDGHGTKRDGYTYDGYEAPTDGQHPGYGGYGPEYGEHYGTHPPATGGSDSGGIIKGSTSLISGIAKGIIGGLVSASGTASQGSSSMSASASGTSSSQSSSSSGHKPPEYGTTYSYEDNKFDVWDFKKAIISTLMQAVKAISGGVIALKGQIIKGSGHLVSSKGKLISSTGDALTSLGSKLAKSTLQQPHQGYTYDHPPSGHDSYDGPPPGLEEEYAGPGNEYHGGGNFESASDDDEHAGLLIVKPTKPDTHGDYDVDQDSQKPTEEDSYEGAVPSSHDKEIENAVTGNLDSYQNHNQENHLEEHNYSLGQPQSSYDVPLHPHALDDPKKEQDYVSYPPVGHGPTLSHHNPLSIQQSIEYPPIHIRYTLPSKDGLDLPHDDPSNNDLSVYSSLLIKPGPDAETIKISTMNHAGGFHLPKLQTHENLHDFPHSANSYPIPVSNGPLKVPLLNPYMLTPQWYSQGVLQSMHNFYRRKSNVQKRRSVNEVARRMRLHKV